MEKRFTLVTDSELLTEDYRVVYAHRVLTAPIPIGMHLLSLDHVSAAQRSGRLGVCLGYLGDARAAKGFLLLPELVRRVLESRGDAHFLIQCAPIASANGEDPAAAAIAALNAAAARWPDRVDLIFGSLDEAQYAETFSKVDIVLLPYLDPHYTTATSGICAEGLALGKPVVVPAGTWMAAELARSGSGIEFDPRAEDDLYEKVVMAIDRYPDLAESAARLAGPYRDFHNEDTLAGMLLAEAGLTLR